MRDPFRKVAEDITIKSLGESDHLRLSVTSGSMVPVLKPGDFIDVFTQQVESIPLGALVVTKNQDGFITHRLIGKDTSGFYLKGDRNKYPDSPVDVHHIVGIVFSVEKMGVPHTLQNTYQLTIARWIGWFGWRSAYSQSRFIRWISYSISRLLSYFIFGIYNCI